MFLTLIIVTIISLIILAIGIFNLQKTWGVLCLIFGTIVLTICLAFWIIFYLSKPIIKFILQYNFPTAYNTAMTAGNIASGVRNTASNTYSNLKSQALYLQQKMANNFTFADFRKLILLFITFSVFFIGVKNFW